MNCTVTKRHESQYPNPVRLTTGCVVSWTPKESEWKGWAWCRDGEGREGWVPEGAIEKHGGMAIALRDYVAAELSVEVGDRLEALTEQAGWLWCKDSRGAQGWVPKENVERGAS